MHYLGKRNIPLTSNAKRKRNGHNNNDYSQDAARIPKIQPIPIVIPKDTKRMENRELGIPNNEEDLLHNFANRGISEDTVNRTSEWTELGPRSGISNACRLQRGVWHAIVICTYLSMF